MEQGFELGKEHVVVPLAFFERVLRVYHAAMADGLVPRPDEAPHPPQSPSTTRPGVNLQGVELVTHMVPPGYVPRGKAASPAPPLVEDPANGD